ncbi:uncharacterized protein [Eurosta solidaginis]|uniref:uncharacterized protein isoform X2 n=1 Tax=Eurosta solidaginis TaxID=178769 RepID=UPI0035309FD7
MKKVKNTQSNNQSIKRFLLPQSPSLPIKKRRKATKNADENTNRNSSAIDTTSPNSKYCGGERSSNDERTFTNKTEDATAPNERNANVYDGIQETKLDWNSFARDPGQLCETSYPITFNTFKTMTHSGKIVRRILEDMRNVTGLDFLNDELIKERVLKNYYKKFYEQPQIRELYQLEIKACPTFVKKKILQIPTKLVNGEAIASSSSPLESNAQAEIFSTPKEPESAATQSCQETPKILPQQNVSYTNTKRISKRNVLNNSEFLLRHIKRYVQDFDKQQIILKRIKSELLQPEQRESSVGQKTCSSTENPVGTVERQQKGAADDNIGMQDVGEKQNSIVGYNNNEQHKSKAINNDDQSQELVDVIEEQQIDNCSALESCQTASTTTAVITTINLIRNAELSAQDMALQQRLRKAQKLYFKKVEKSCTLPYILRLFNGVKRSIIVAILNMSFTEFQHYTNIYDGAEIYKDAQLLNRCYDYTFKVPQVWPVNLYMRITDLFHFLQAKGVNLTATDLKYISPKFLHWKDLIATTNYDYIVYWDYYRSSGNKIDISINTLDLYAQSFYAKCWYQDKWIWHTPRILPDKLNDFPCTLRENETVKDDENKIFERGVVMHALRREHEVEIRQMVITGGKNNYGTLAVIEAKNQPKSAQYDVRREGMEVNETTTNEARDDNLSEKMAKVSINREAQASQIASSSKSSTQTIVDTVESDQTDKAVADNGMQDLSEKQKSAAVDNDDQSQALIEDHEIGECSALTSSQTVSMTATWATTIDLIADISVQDVALQQRLQKVQDIYFKKVAGSCTLPFILRLFNGVKRSIIAAILSMTFTEFQHYTNIYDGAEIYKDAQLLNRCYDYTFKEPKVWPVNLYMRLTDLFQFLHAKGVTLTASGIKYVSPKFLHWQDLIAMTNYDYIVHWDYYRSSGNKFNESTSSLDIYSQNFYVKCWYQDKWIWHIPRILPDKLHDFPFAKCANTADAGKTDDENIIFERGVVMHALRLQEIGTSETVVTIEEKNSRPHNVAAVDAEMQTTNHLQDDVGQREIQATEKSDPKRLDHNVRQEAETVNAEIQTSQSLLGPVRSTSATQEPAGIQNSNTYLPLQSRDIKKEKLTPLNKLEFDLTADDDNHYECVQVPDGVIELDASTGLSQSPAELLLPLSNSENLDTNILLSELNDLQITQKINEEQEFEMSSEQVSTKLNSQHKDFQQEKQTSEEGVGSQAIIFKDTIKCKQQLCTNQMISERLQSLPENISCNVTHSPTKKYTTLSQTQMITLSTQSEEQDMARHTEMAELPNKSQTTWQLNSNSQATHQQSSLEDQGMNVEFELRPVESVIDTTTECESQLLKLQQEPLKSAEIETTLPRYQKSTAQRKLIQELAEQQPLNKQMQETVDHAEHLLQDEECLTVLTHEEESNAQQQQSRQQHEEISVPGDLSAEMCSLDQSSEEAKDIARFKEMEISTHAIIPKEVVINEVQKPICETQNQMPQSQPKQQEMDQEQDQQEQTQLHQHQQLEIQLQLEKLKQQQKKLQLQLLQHQQLELELKLQQQQFIKQEEYAPPKGSMQERKQKPAAKKSVRQREESVQKQKQTKKVKQSEQEKQSQTLIKEEVPAEIELLKQQQIISEHVFLLQQETLNNHLLQEQEYAETGIHEQTTAMQQSKVLLEPLETVANQESVKQENHIEEQLQQQQGDPTEQTLQLYVQQYEHGSQDDEQVREQYEEVIEEITIPNNIQELQSVEQQHSPIQSANEILFMDEVASTRCDGPELLHQLTTHQQQYSAAEQHHYTATKQQTTPTQQPQIILQRTRTHVQEQLMFGPTITSTQDIMTTSKRQEKRIPKKNMRTAATTTSSNRTSVRAAKATKAAAAKPKLTAKNSDYVPQLTHVFPALPIALNNKKIMSPVAPAAIPSTETITTLSITCNELSDNHLQSNQLVSAVKEHNFIQNTTTNAPILITLPPVSSIISTHSTSSNSSSYVYGLSGDKTLFNSTDLLQIIEQYQLENRQSIQQQHEAQSLQSTQHQQLQLLQQPQTHYEQQVRHVYEQSKLLQLQQPQNVCQQQLEVYHLPSIQQQQIEQLHQVGQQPQHDEQQYELQQPYEDYQQQQLVLHKPHPQLDEQEQLHEKQQQQLKRMPQEHTGQQEQYILTTPHHPIVYQLVDVKQTTPPPHNYAVQQYQLNSEDPHQQDQQEHYIIKLEGEIGVGIENAHIIEFKDEEELERILSTHHSQYLQETSLQQQQNEYKVTTNEMLQVNISVQHNYTKSAPMSPLPNKLLDVLQLSSPTKAIAVCRMRPNVRLKPFLFSHIEALDYFSEVTTRNIADYQLQCTSIGQPYLQAKIRTSHLRALVVFGGDMLKSLLPRCTPTLLQDLSIILQYLGEFHYNKWEQRQQRKLISKCTHRTLHTLCAQVLLLFFTFSSPFQTQNEFLKLEHEARDYLCAATATSANAPTTRQADVLDDISLAIEPSILEEMAALKRNL